jgi:hypothetical protein
MAGTDFMIILKNDLELRRESQDFPCFEEMEDVCSSGK